ncbi:hypothetical protein H257_19210 [Aphanomyces astaci]|uniref:Uncharacterized protein n=1 Tax=Aphanomyces astaci TaxID=112090 RepID=W4FAA3_APHAT|nr:hypothetical protein H257_19210 [Aphanomyces astaci]ETV63854.1 hypothetical protein H257_19210 [Aphanomyces astaci]|eukprot:XP_009846661.1 hypothetical protein H257_19210 [Aphanomyces astaci]
MDIRVGDALFPVLPCDDDAVGTEQSPLDDEFGSGVPSNNGQSKTQPIMQTTPVGDDARLKVQPIMQTTPVGDDARLKVHREATQRLELADRAQHAYFLAYEVECEMADLALWTEAMIIPQSWRLAIRKHLAPILLRMKLHVGNLMQAESMLLPPFDERKRVQFDLLLQSTEDISVVLYDSIQECKRKAIEGERVVAASMIQLHARRRLRVIGFYTTKVKLTRLQRGLIPGLFDGLKGETIMNITADSITLEYPKTANRNATGRGNDSKPNQH